MRKVRFKAVTAVGAATAAMLITGTSPAFAAGAGVTFEGSSSITASGPIANPLCIQTNGSSARITLENAGAVMVGTSTFVGGTEATFNIRQFYLAPQGTYPNTATQDCSGLPSAVTVFGGGLTTKINPAGDSVACTWDSGTYTRDLNVYRIHVEGSCTYTPAVGTPGSPQNTKFDFDGNENPCLEGFLVSVPNCTDLVVVPLSQTEFQGAYVQDSPVSP